ncbi:hypothetical protein LCGC14_0758010, partial [marine sediment metagenome]
YKDGKQKKNEIFIGHYLEKYVPETPFECPLLLTMMANFVVPKSRSQWWREAALRGIIQHTSTPDLDNLIKNITDVMQDMQFYRNDNQIVQINANKRYSLKYSWAIALHPINEPGSKKEYIVNNAQYNRANP